MPAGADHKSEIEALFCESGPVFKRIKVLSEMLSEKDFLLDHLTFADLMLTFTARFTGAVCYSQLGFSPYARFSSIVALMARVSSLPGIKQRLDPATNAPYLLADIVPFKLLNFQEMIDLDMKPI